MIAGRGPHKLLKWRQNRTSGSASNCFGKSVSGLLLRENGRSIENSAFGPLPIDRAASKPPRNTNHQGFYPALPKWQHFKWFRDGILPISTDPLCRISIFFTMAGAILMKFEPGFIILKALLYAIFTRHAILMLLLFLLPRSPQGHPKVKFSNCEKICRTNQFSWYINIISF